VQGAGDTTPPQLVDFRLSPGVLNTTRADQVVAVSVHLTDDFIGIMPLQSGLPSSAAASASFRSPSKTHLVSFNWLYRLAGNECDGDYFSALTVPRFSESGIWVLDAFNTTDALGNAKQYTLADFLRLGFPAQFTVSDQPSLTATKTGGTLLLSWPNGPASYRLQSNPTLSDADNWSDVPLEPSVRDWERVIAVPISDAQRFYRLVQ
jgi:hypothetical protein